MTKAPIDTPERIRWVRFALALRYACVCAAEGAVGRNKSDGSVRFAKLYETPYLELVPLQAVGEGRSDKRTVARPRETVPTNLATETRGSLILTCSQLCAVAAVVKLL